MTELPLGVERSPRRETVHQCLRIRPDVRLEGDDTRWREVAGEDAAQLVVARRIHVEHVGGQERHVGVDERPLRRRPGLPVGQGPVDVLGAAQHPVVRPDSVVVDLTAVDGMLVAHYAVKGPRIAEVGGVERIELERGHDLWSPFVRTLLEGLTIALYSAARSTGLRRGKPCVVWTAGSQLLLAPLRGLGGRALSGWRRPA